MLNNLINNTKDMTLPALSSELPPLKKSSSASLQRANRASLRPALNKPSKSRHGHLLLLEQDSISTHLNKKDLASPTSGQAKKGLPTTSHFLTERQRREFLNEKYQALRSLIPNPTKTDRASIVQDAIDYVQELKERMQELQHVKELKDPKRGTAGDDGTGRSKNSGMARSGSHELKTSTWMQLTSKYGTEVDVRVVDNETIIKVTQQWLPHSLLLNAVLMLHELQLELLHANGGRIGNHNVYMLNAKIPEGRDLSAGQVASRLLESFDQRFIHHASHQLAP